MRKETAARAKPCTRDGASGPAPAERTRLRGPFRPSAHSRPARRPRAGLGGGRRPPGLPVPRRPSLTDLGRSPRARVSDWPHVGARPSRTLYLLRASPPEAAAAAVTAVVVVDTAAGPAGWGRRRRRVRFGVGFRLRVPARRAAPGTWRRVAGWASGRVPFRDFFPIASPSASRERRTAEGRALGAATRAIIDHTLRRRLLQGSA